MTYLVFFFLELLNEILKASAAAVPSSSNEAFETGNPVKSEITVWKFNNDSKRPCETSGWYGVYEVYHSGDSKTFLLITGGVIVL